MVDEAGELSRFFGRQSELQLLEELFEEQGRRVVTLVGASGSGKSRLARELARTFAGGRVVVDLSQATTLDQLIARTAAALDQPLHEVHDLGVALDQIGSALSQGTATGIVFDRADQLGGALAEALPKWAAAAPNARFILTSRARLGLTGAVEVELDGLPKPAAVDLFVDRARLQRADWNPSAEELSDLGELVERLGGLPLAVELAAARSNLFGVREMLEHVDRQRATHEAPTDALSRTLFDAIEESWRLLSDNENLAASACSVFAGSFTLDAAEAVLLEIEGSIVDVLYELSKKSILRRAARAGRLGMLEPVRAFASERLHRNRELEKKARDRHAEYFMAVASRARLEHLESGEPESLELLATELENLDAAFGWCVAENNASGVATLALALHTLFWARGPIGLHLSMLERAIPIAESADIESRVDLLLAKSTALGHGVGREAAISAARQALEVARAGGHAQREGRAWARIARVHSGYGEAEKAAEAARRALELAQAAGDALGEAYATSTIGAALLKLGELEQARSQVVSALGLLRVVRRPRLELESLELLAAIERARGRGERALAVLEDALDECKRMGDERMIANVSGELGILREQAGETDRARNDYERAAAALQRLGCRHEELGMRLSAAALGLARGDVTRERCEQALELAKKLGDRSLQALAAALSGVAEVRADRFGHAERAFELAESSSQAMSEGLPEAIALYHGVYDLALARRADREGRRDEAERLRKAVRERLVPKTHWSDRVRQAARLLERELESTRPVELIIAFDGSWFSTTSSPRISIANRPTLCRLLALLASQRLESPGVPLDYRAIGEALWPAERVLEHAAKSRIHVAISTLRKLGLGELIQGGSRGYSLDPSIAVGRAES